MIKVIPQPGLPFFTNYIAMNNYETRRRHYKSLKKYRDFRILIWLGIGCFIVFGLFLLLTNVIFCNPNEFGDSAGATNGLFSALAFAGVIYAIFLQKDELSLQRQELKNTRKELSLIHI